MGEFTQKDFDNELFKADYSEFKEDTAEKFELLMQDNKQMFDQIMKKLDGLDMIFIVNGGSDGKEVGFKRKDLFQILYDNGVKKTKTMEEFFKKEIAEIKSLINNHIDSGFKSGVNKLSWWGTKLLPIIIVTGIMLSLIYVLLGQHELAEKIQSLTKNN